MTVWWLFFKFVSVGEHDHGFERCDLLGQFTSSNEAHAAREQVLQWGVIKDEQLSVMSSGCDYKGDGVK